MNLPTKYSRPLAALWLILWLTACSATKNLPEGEVLYTGIQTIAVEAEDATPTGQYALDEAKAALEYPPNNALLGSSSVRIPFPFKLWVYNAFVNKKGKLNQWIFKKLAGKPVLVSTVNPEVRIKVAQNLLQENGYFGGTVSYETHAHPKDPRKAKLSYAIAMNAPYTLDSIAYAPIRDGADSLVHQNIHQSLLRKGDNFSISSMDQERQRISSLLRSNGYFYFRPEFVTYQADTLLNPGKVAVRVIPKDNLPPAATHPWRLGDISLHLHGYQNEAPTDSIRYRDLMIHYQGKLRVRPSVVYRRLQFRPGDSYSQQQQERTQSALSRLGIFRYSEMQYQPKDSTGLQDTLNLRINTVYDLPLDGELEVNVTAKSNNQIGPGAVFSLTKRNIFGGGETFGVKLLGSYEWQVGRRVASTSSLINSYELALTTTLTFPSALLPVLDRLDSKQAATTSFQLYVDQMSRAGYFKLLAFGGDAAFEFQTSPVSKHQFTPFKLTFNLLQDRSHDFDSIMEKNPALYKSLQNQFIPAMSYTYTYDDTPITSKRHRLWAQFSVTEAGLLVNSAYALAGNPFSEKDKNLLGNPYAQFIKASAEVRYNRDLGWNQHLVGRVMVGAAYSYGNAQTTPYNEQFYVGGANSIRAFTIRSIGPGRFIPDPDNQYAHIDQTGDVKFEANLEYRFPILGDLHGATFLDCGNVWLLRNDPNRPGGQLRWNSFLNDLALGTGLGLRYVLPFLVVRVDLGIGLHVPFDTGKKGYYNIPSFKDGLGFHLAIGYPF